MHLDLNLVAYLKFILSLDNFNLLSTYTRQIMHNGVTDSDENALFKFRCLHISFNYLTVLNKEKCPVKRMERRK